MQCFKATEENVRILGRTKLIDGIRYINYSCSGIEFEFTGTKASTVLCSDSSKWDETKKAWIAVFIDDEAVPSKRFSLEKDEDTYTLYKGFAPRKVKIKLIKMSEAAFGKAGIKEIVVEGGNEIAPTSCKQHRIEFIGDSITCGYGIEGVFNVDGWNCAQENPWEAYAAKTARYLDADFNLVSWSGIGIIFSWTDKDNYWQMPELYKYTDGGIDRYLGKTEYELWDNSKFKPELIIINLGTNDAGYTQGIKEREEAFTEGYYKFLKQVRECNPDSIIICALGAMGQDLCAAVETAVNNFKRTNDESKIHTLVFDIQLDSDGIGTDWHPSLKTQDKMSKKLIDKVIQIMNYS